MAEVFFLSLWAGISISQSECFSLDSDHHRNLLRVFTGRQKIFQTTSGRLYHYLFFSKCGLQHYLCENTFDHITMVSLWQKNTLLWLKIVKRRSRYDTSRPNREVCNSIWKRNEIKRAGPDCSIYRHSVSRWLKTMFFRFTSKRCLFFKRPGKERNWILTKEPNLIKKCKLKNNQVLHFYVACF